MLYRHVATEIWYPAPNSTIYKICDNSGEDTTCSNSVGPLHWSTADHMHYMGIYSDCNE